MSDKMIGFVGLGVMGEAMCANLQRKSREQVIAFDLNPAPLTRLASEGVKGSKSLKEVAQGAEVIILSLPSAAALKAVVEGEDGLIAHMAPGAVIIDTSTSPVDYTRELAIRARARGLDYADAPVARTREAALRGELSIMVGASENLFKKIKPVLARMGSEVTLCGPVGSGQVVKIVNNMVLFLNVMSLAEGMSLARRAGITPDVLLDVIAKGSGDSFALRNHGMKAMLPRTYPEKAFSTRYAQKDLSLALALAQSAGVELAAANLLRERLQEAEAAGYGDNYFPALREIIDPQN